MMKIHPSPKTRPLALFAALLSWCFAAQAYADKTTPKPWQPLQMKRLALKHKGQFPTVSGKNLSNQTRKLPQQLYSKVNIVLLAFLRKHQKSFKTWDGHLRKLKKKYAGLDYMKIPVLGGFAGLFGYFIVRGMRKAAPDRQDKERTMPLFISQSTFFKSLKFQGKQQISIVLTDQKGRVFWMGRGDWTKALARQLEQAITSLKKKPTQG